MNHKQFLHCLLTITILLCALTNVRAQADENVVLQWNRVLTETIRTPGAHPSATVWPVRSYAMMHAAMFDAVNSIDGTYTPYLTEVPGSQQSSPEAAVAQAAHDVLIGLYPSRRAIFDAELAESLDGIPIIRAQLGIRVGELVAARMLAARANDGWNASPPPYVLRPTPGNWQPTPPIFAPATFTHFPNVLPFALISPRQFGPPPPPAFTSAQYAADFNEVKEIGSVNSTTRTADQTLIAQLWASTNTPITIFLAWNNVARSVAVSRNLTTIEMARLFALFNIAVHDALQTSFTGKFDYGLWRPITAIRRADEDGNPNTDPDPNWSSLIPAPPYPAYPGNQAAVSMAHATVFRLFFGRDDIAFQNTWEGIRTLGFTRSYPSFTAMANEVSEGRIYAGIHFRYEQTAGQTIGRDVANYVFQNFMTPRVTLSAQ